MMTPNASPYHDDSRSIGTSTGTSSDGPNGNNKISSSDEKVDFYSNSSTGQEKVKVKQFRGKDKEGKVKKNHITDSSDVMPDSISDAPNNGGKELSVTTQIEAFGTTSDQHCVEEATTSTDDPANSIENGGNVAETVTANFAATPTSESEGRKLFVGGLPMDITDPEFYMFFAKFGEILDCAVMFDRDTGRSRGFGFVTYSDPQVSRSLIRHNSVVDGVGRFEMRGGKVCEVKIATPRNAANGPGNGGRRQQRRDFNNVYNSNYRNGGYGDHSMFLPSPYRYSGGYPLSSAYNNSVTSGGYYHHAALQYMSSPNAEHEMYLHGTPPPGHYVMQQPYPPSGPISPVEASMMMMPVVGAPAYGSTFLPHNHTVHQQQDQYQYQPNNSLSSTNYTSVMQAVAPGLPNRASLSSMPSAPPSLEETETSDDDAGGGGQRVSSNQKNQKHQKER